MVQHRQEDDSEQQMPDKNKVSSLPWRQLSILLLMRLAEPIAFTIIFPFIGDMIWEIGATKDRSQVGTYAGVIESLFAAVQTLTVLHWARASDIYGRKPIIINGLIGSTLSSLLFGFSTSFPMLVGARCLTGALNGNVAIYKATVGELTDKTNAARAFSTLPVVWALGCTIGPLLGGYLSQPAKRYPWLFSTHDHGILAFGGLFEKYPFALPCIASSAVSLSSILLGFFLLEETLPSKVAQKKPPSIAKRNNSQEATRPLLTTENHRSYGSSSQSTHATSSNETPRFARVQKKRSRMGLGRVQSFNSGFTPTSSRPSSIHENHQVQCDCQSQRNVSSSRIADAEESHEEDSSRTGVLSLLRIGHIRRIMVSYAFLSLISVSLDSVQVLYFWEPISLGGLSFPSTITGTIFSISGVIGVALQLFVFPGLQKRLGTLRLYRLSLAAFPFVPAIAPLANIIAKKGLQSIEHEGGFVRDVDEVSKAFVWVLIGFAMTLKTLGSMAFSCNIMLVNQASALAPGAQMGTLNGLAQMSSSLMRAVGPYAASTLFSITIAKHLLGGYLVWVLLFFCAISSVYSTIGLMDIEKMVDRGEIDEDAANPRG